MPYAPDEVTHTHPPTDGYCPDWGACPFGRAYCGDPSCGTLIACGGLVGDDRLCLHRVRRPMVTSKAAQAKQNEEGLLQVARWAVRHNCEIVLRFGDTGKPAGRITVDAATLPKRSALARYLREVAGGAPKGPSAPSAAGKAQGRR